MRIDPCREELPDIGTVTLPSLCDAHVHPSRWQAPWLVAAGIGCVRATGPGATLPKVSVYHAGRILDGPSPTWPGSLRVCGVEQAEFSVKRVLDCGASLVKTYDGMSSEVLGAIASCAHESGLKVTGHVPPGMSWLNVVMSGLDCIEHCTGLEVELLTDHGMGVLRGLQTDSHELSPARLFAERASIICGELSRERARGLFTLMSERGVAWCPTLTLHNSMFRGIEERLTQEGIASLPSELLASWLPGRDFRTAELLSSEPSLVLRANQALQRVRRELVRIAWECGVMILAGTDLGNPWIVPGVSLLDEIGELVLAGLPGVEAFKCASCHPKAWLGVDDCWANGEICLSLTEDGVPAALRLRRALLAEEMGL